MVNFSLKLWCFVFLFLLFSFELLKSEIKIVPIEPTMANYWDGKADWQIYYNLPIAGWHAAAGTSIEVVDGIWYWFQRYQVSNQVPRQDGQVKLGTECRKSTDKGLTWSNPVTVISPDAGTAWSLMATDGDFYYDASENKWRCLFQSLSDIGAFVWTCSYVERDGNDPMGPFTAPSGFTNPAINAKEIWSKIANNPTKDCVKLSGSINQIYDEGTPEIVYRIGNVFYVTFHGAANVGLSIYGFRGIATTSDFQTYTPAAPDCIFDAYDTNKWTVAWQGDLNGNAGSIGVGQSTSIKEGNYWYTLIEGSDKSLGGTDGQNWTYGLFRSSNLTSSSWDNWSNNPDAVFAPHQLLLEWQYARLFKDGRVTYCAINKANPTVERAFKIYKLVWNVNKMVHFLY